MMRITRGKEVPEVVLTSFSWSFFGYTRISFTDKDVDELNAGD
jgi:hypothetical protein